MLTSISEEIILEGLKIYDSDLIGKDGLDQK